MKARIRRLSREIAASLKGDRKRRVEIAGEEVETLLGADPLNRKEAWSVVAALKGSLKGTALVVAGDLNTALDDPKNDRRGTEIAAALTEADLADMTAHFLPRRQRWGREQQTWIMVREGKVVRSGTDYILGIDRSLFRNLSVWDPQHNTDHFMVVGCLHSAPAREHVKYLTGQKKLPLQPPTEPTRENGIFAALRRAVPKPRARERRTN